MPLLATTRRARVIGSQVPGRPDYSAHGEARAGGLSHRRAGFVERTLQFGRRQHAPGLGQYGHPGIVSSARALRLALQHLLALLGPSVRSCFVHVLENLTVEPGMNVCALGDQGLQARSDFGHQPGTLRGDKQAEGAQDRSRCRRAA